MESGIYIIKNILNGKYYVGSSNKVKRRMGDHIKHLNRVKQHHSIKLQRSWDKYGCDAFIFEVIQYCNVDDLIINEQYWIDHFDSYNKGYNCNPFASSSRGRKLSDETKIKIGLASKGNQYNKGRVHSEEEKIKRANSIRGKKRTDETKRKIGATKIGNSFGLGYKHTDISKEKIRQAHVGIACSEEHKKKISLSKKGQGLKPILQFDLNDNFIREWAGGTIVQEVLKISAKTINTCCNGHTKTSGGYKWKFKN